MRSHSFVALVLVCAASLSFNLPAGNAGPLTPPPGPVTSTDKPLGEVEPRIAVNATNTPGDASTLFKITQPGSYYLTENVAGVAFKDGIQITASGVTLDLMGFEVLGVAASGDGISVTVGVSNVHIRNGSVRNWGDDGVQIGSAFNSTLADLHSGNNGNQGLRIGAGGVVRNCNSYLNGGTGIYTSDTALVEGCTVRSNGADVGGSNGIQTSTAALVRDCTVLGQTGHGISAGIGSSVLDCNVATSSGDGIRASVNSTISRCTSKGNTGNGIRAFGGTTVRDCNSSGNGAAGVEFSAECYILNNHLDSNGPGLLTTEDDSRIDGNAITGGGVSLSIGGAQNLIIRNTYDGAIAGVVGNHWGSIITLSGFDDITTTVPWANFAY